MRKRLLIMLLVLVLAVTSTACSARRDGLEEENLPVPPLSGSSQAGAPTAQQPAVVESQQIPADTLEAPEAEAGVPAPAQQPQSDSQETKETDPESPTAGMVLDADADADGDAELQQLAGEAQMFNYGGTSIMRVYARDYFGYTYAPLSSEQQATVVELLMRAGKNEPSELYSRTDGGFLVSLADGTRFSYMLVPTAIRVGTEAYPIDQASYDTLKSIADSALQSGPLYIQWLAYMRQDWVRAVTIQTDSSGGVLYVNEDDIATAAYIIANLRTRGGGETFDAGRSFAKEPGNTIIRLTFDGGVTYKIEVKDRVLYLESSDMGYGCSYPLLTSISSLEQALSQIAAPRQPDAGAETERSEGAESSQAQTVPAIQL